MLHLRCPHLARTKDAVVVRLPFGISQCSPRPALPHKSARLWPQRTARCAVSFTTDRPHRHCLLMALRQAYIYHNAHPWPYGDRACHPYTEVERSAYAIDTLILYQSTLTDTMRSAILSALTPG